MTEPVSTPARSARNSKPKAGSSWRVRIVSGTAAGPIRISVSSWRWRTGPVSCSPKRSSRRRLKARSTASDALRNGGPDGPLRPVAAAVLDELLELHHAVDEALRPRRAAGDIDVDRHDPVDPLDRRVAPLVATAGARAVAHRDAPLRLRHLLPE